MKGSKLFARLPLSKEIPSVVCSSHASEDNLGNKLLSHSGITLKLTSKPSKEQFKHAPSKKAKPVFLDESDSQIESSAATVKLKNFEHRCFNYTVISPSKLASFPAMTEDGNFSTDLFFNNCQKSEEQRSSFARPIVRNREKLPDMRKFRVNEEGSGFEQEYRKLNNHWISFYGISFLSLCGIFSSTIAMATLDGSQEKLYSALDSPFTFLVVLLISLIPFVDTETNLVQFVVVTLTALALFYLESDSLTALVSYRLGDSVPVIQTKSPIHLPWASEIKQAAGLENLFNYERFLEFFDSPEENCAFAVMAISLAAFVMAFSRGRIRT